MDITHLTLDQIFELEAQNPLLVGSRTVVFLPQKERRMVKKEILKCGSRGSLESTKAGMHRGVKAP